MKLNISIRIRSGSDTPPDAPPDESERDNAWVERLADVMPIISDVIDRLFDRARGEGPGPVRTVHLGPDDEGPDDEGPSA